MLEFQTKKRRRQGTTTPPTPVQPLRRTVSASSINHAAGAQLSGLARFSRLGNKSSSSTSNISEPSPSLSPEEQAAQDHQNNVQTVRAEIEKYETAGIIGPNDPRLEDFNLLRFWQVYFQLF